MCGDGVFEVRGPFFTRHINTKQLHVFRQKNLEKICVIPLRTRKEFTLIQEHAEILHNTNAPLVAISKLPVVAQTVSYMLGIDRSVRPGSAARFKSSLIR